MPMLLKACVQQYLVRAGRAAWHETGLSSHRTDVSCDQRAPTFVPAAADVGRLADAVSASKLDTHSAQPPAPGRPGRSQPHAVTPRHRRPDAHVRSSGAVLLL
jgi:hypothetical protein